MTIISKAIRRIESKLDQRIDLAILSDLLGVSPHHLSLAFRFASGLSPMAYVRARRALDHQSSQAADIIMTYPLQCAPFGPKIAQFLQHKGRDHVHEETNAADPSCLAFHSPTSV